MINRRHALGLLAAASLLPSRGFANVAPQRSEIRETWPSILSMSGRSAPSSATRSTIISIIASDKEPLGRGEAAGLDLQDSEFADRAGDRRGRRSRQGRLQVGRRRQKHRGLEQRPHHALGDRGLRGAGLSGDRAAHRRGADAEICRPVRIRQPRYRRRHRPVLADRQSAHRSGPAGRFRRPAAARRPAGLQTQPGSGARYPAGDQGRRCHHPRQERLAGRRDRQAVAGLDGGLGREGRARGRCLRSIWIAASRAISPTA